MWLHGSVWGEKERGEKNTSRTDREGKKLKEKTTYKKEVKRRWFAVELATVNLLEYSQSTPKTRDPEG